MFSINVVIPVLNESGHIVRCLEQFRGATSVGIVVVDGGSSDSTPDQVAETGLATLIQTDRSGRARQMNLGARASDGEILLFYTPTHCCLSRACRGSQPALRIQGWRADGLDLSCRKQDGDSA